MGLSIELAEESVDETFQLVPRYLRRVLFDDDALSAQAKYTCCVLAALFENPAWAPCHEGLATMMHVSRKSSIRWTGELQTRGFLRIRPIRDARQIIRRHEWTLFAVPGDESQAITRGAPTLLGLVAESR